MLLKYNKKSPKLNCDYFARGICKPKVALGVVAALATQTKADKANAIFKIISADFQNAVSLRISLVLNDCRGNSLLVKVSREATVHQNLALAQKCVQ